MHAPATILLFLTRVDCNDGVASYLESIVSGLRDAGDTVVIVSGEVTTLYASEQRRSAIAAAARAWIVLDGLRPARPRLSHLRALTTAIKRYDVDVVSPQGFAALPLGTLAARLTRRPVVTNFHLLPTLRPRWQAVQKFMYRLVASICRSDRYLATSTEISNFFRSVCGIPQRRIHRQLLGVDTEFYRVPTEAERAAARERFGLTPTALVTVLPARLNATKGHDIAAAAFRLLRERRPDAELICLFAGAGDERDAIEAATLRDEADRRTFRFLGFIERAALREAYWASDVVLLPSRVEGFGLGVAEAMCCGAVAIRTPSGGWQDQIVEGKTGFLVPFDDAPALAAALEKLLDTSTRSHMRDEAIALASRAFARTGMIAGTSALYRAMAAGRHRVLARSAG